MQKLSGPGLDRDQTDIDSPWRSQSRSQKLCQGWDRQVSGPAKTAWDRTRPNFPNTSPVVGDSSLDIAEWYSCCTVLPTSLPRDVAVIPASPIAGQHESGTTSGVSCVTSLVAWVQRPPHISSASLESQVHDSSHSCGSTSSTCPLSRGAEAATCSDDCPVLSCGSNAPRGLSSAPTVASGSLTSWGLLFPRIL